MVKSRFVEVFDKMQGGYVYRLTEPPGCNFHHDFRPELSPKEMLALGVFGGKYMTDCCDEFPSDWFENAKLCAERHDPALNFFGVNASQPLAEWRRKGWIRDHDPRGWFQWYCRYFIEADAMWMMSARSAAGGPWRGTSRRSGRAVPTAISTAIAGSARRCSTGPTTRGWCDR